MVKIISWNIARSSDAWRSLVETDADIALLQEAAESPDDIAKRVRVDSARWHTGGAGKSRPWRTAVVGLSDRVGMEWIAPKAVDDAEPGDFVASRAGSISAARITPGTGEPFIVASLYGVWENPHRSTESSWIYADGSVHRLISDLSGLIGQQAGHRLIAAVDLNILHGYGEDGSRYWADRYATVFSRMEALGLPFIGPQAPDGRVADPWPEELPRGSKNVPTFHTNHQSPATATRQLDFVFASRGLAETVRVRALNEPDQWGPSDHCRIEIAVT